MNIYVNKPTIAPHVLRALFWQIREVGVLTTIWIGTAALMGEEVIREIMSEEAGDLDADIDFIRQN